MMKYIYNIIAMAFVGLAMLKPIVAVAADAEVTARACWEQGVDAYESRDYASSIEAFEQVVALGYVSADLYYNLGNAYFKYGQQLVEEGLGEFSGGELGRAVLNYHRALKLNPAMEDAEYNLDLAKDYTNDTESLPESFIAGLWVGLRNIMSINAWTIVSIVMLAVLFVLVIFYLLSDRVAVRKVSFFTALVLFICLILSTSLAVSSRRAMLNDCRAVVVVADITSVHASPDSNSKVIRQPSQGVTVSVGREHGEWCEIVFADGEKGWIRLSQIEKI